MRFRSLSVAAFAAALTAPLAFAGPRLFEETARLVPPDVLYTPFVDQTAVDGDRVLLSSVRFDDHIWIGSVYLFERAASGSWQYVTTLVSDERVGQPVYDPSVLGVAIKGDVAAVASYQHLRIFERVGGAWVNTGNFQAPSATTRMGRDVEVDGTTVIVSAYDAPLARALTYTKNSAGQWVQDAALDASAPPPDDGAYGPDADISSNVAVVSNAVTQGEHDSGELFIYDRSGNGWAQSARFDAPDSFGGVATDGTTVVGSRGDDVRGTVATAYRRVGGAWTPVQRLESDGSQDALSLGGYDAGAPYWNQLDVEGALAATVRSVDLKSGSRTSAADIYELGASGSSRPVARLRLSHDREPISSVKLSGRRVVLAAGGGAYIYDLPADFSQPAIVQDDFETGSAAEWAPIAGSAFSVVTGANGTRLYRQSSVAGAAAAIRGNTDWQNQGIEATVTPRSFNGSDRWFGLVTRYLNEDNYYYVAWRSSQVIELKRMLNGQFTTLASATLPVALNKTYTLRLEATGTGLKVFVDGVQQLQTHDSSLTHGSAGVRSYKASVDYDNVVITPNARNTLYSEDFTYRNANLWEQTGGTWSFPDEGTNTGYAQISVDGPARSITSIPIDDQVIQVRAKPTAYATGGTDRWFGITGRYVDENNYYYITVRNNNRISLRRIVGGSHVELDSAPLTVTLGQWYTLRLEIVGNKLRGYVDGVPLVEATDNTFAKGRYGLLMYKTATTYDNVEFSQP